MAQQSRVFQLWPSRLNTRTGPAINSPGILIPSPHQSRNQIYWIDCYCQGCFRSIFFMRESRVVGLMPMNSAAPSRPLIYQPVRSSTVRRFARSRPCSSTSVKTLAQAWCLEAASMASGPVRHR